MTTQEAIDHYGSVKRLAAALDVFPQAIMGWGEEPPMGRQYELQIKTNNKLMARGAGDELTQQSL